jgi:G:T-mismatch repair DNA endonuclease (very short patch repair protein)
MNAAALATARASRSWRFRTSRTEKRAAELLDALGLVYRTQVPAGPFTVDIMLPAEQIAIDVHGGHWHDLPEAQERDQRRRARLEASGYKVLVLRESAMHLWWLQIQQALKSSPLPPG